MLFLNLHRKGSLRGDIIGQDSQDYLSIPIDTTFCRCVMPIQSLCKASKEEVHGGVGTPQVTVTRCSTLATCADSVRGRGTGSESVIKERYENPNRIVLVKFSDIQCLTCGTHGVTF
jgi:hypothetical protein